MSLKMSLLLLLLFSGCSSFSPAFVSTVSDHKELALETNRAIINTLVDECASETDPENLEAAAELIERLEIIMSQAEAIDAYVRHLMTEEELAKYLAFKWRGVP